ncbi:MAG: GNAT family N-acetyltransferase [Tissierellaceae bacterium]
MLFYDTSDLIDGEIYLRLDRTAGENKEKAYLPAYYFTIIRSLDRAEIGKCDLRIGHNENTKYGGNIGYEVFEEFRGNKYATKACKLMFSLAKKHGMDYLIITCNPDNIASRKTCEHSGGELIDILDIPSWHEMSKTRKTTCQYRMKL